MSGWGIGGIVVVRKMWVRAFKLHEAFGADLLVAAAGAVEVGGVVEEADWAFGGVGVKGCFEGAGVDEAGGVVGEAVGGLASVGGGGDGEGFCAGAGGAWEAEGGGGCAGAVGV